MMIIFLLAAAMTIAMLIATFLAIHQEQAQVAFDERAARVGRLGLQ